MQGQATASWPHGTEGLMWVVSLLLRNGWVFRKILGRQPSKERDQQVPTHKAFSRKKNGGLQQVCVGWTRLGACENQIPWTWSGKKGGTTQCSTGLFKVGRMRLFVMILHFKHIPIKCLFKVQLNCRCCWGPWSNNTTANCFRSSEIWNTL